MSELAFSTPCLGGVALQAMDREELTVTDTAGGLTVNELEDDDTGGIARPPKAASVHVVDQPIRVTFNGTTATNTLGVSFNADSHFIVYGLQNLINLSMIREGGSSAEVEVIYWR